MARLKVKISALETELKPPSISLAFVPSSRSRSLVSSTSTRTRHAHQVNIDAPQQASKRTLSDKDTSQAKKRSKTSTATTPTTTTTIPPTNTPTQLSSFPSTTTTPKDPLHPVSTPAPQNRLSMEEPITTNHPSEEPQNYNEHGIFKADIIALTQCADEHANNSVVPPAPSQSPKVTIRDENGMFSASCNCAYNEKKND